MALKPLYDKIIVKPEIKKNDMTESGIYIPETSNDKPQIGTVLSVGEGYLLDDGNIKPLSIKEGDKVIFQKYVGSEIKIKDEKEPLLIISERDVLCTIEKQIEK